MNERELENWSRGLYVKGEESILMETALKTVNGVELFVMTCIVFLSVEGRDLYFMRNRKVFNDVHGFLHLLN
jgi:hypothetical protein